MLGTKSWLCCNIENLGGFRAAITLRLPLSGEWKVGQSLQKFINENRNSFKVPIQSKIDKQKQEVMLFTACRLGKKASEHIQSLTQFAKQIIELYRDFYTASPEIDTQKHEDEICISKYHEAFEKCQAKDGQISIAQLK